jgi:cytochrome c oxidase cbb3-type subunit 4
MDYTTMRQFADSWVLLVMFIFFVCAAAWALRPSARVLHQDAASIPFKDCDDDRPS